MSVRFQAIANPPLLDLFGRFHNYLRVSLTERCNLRCDYCMPADGVKLTPDKELLSTQELLELIEVFVSLGITKIRLTGGEPTLRKDILPIATRISELGIKNLGITTNGILLTRMASSLKMAGVNRINISLDTLDSVRFEKITKRLGHGKVVEGILHCLDLGFQNIKINCVIKRGLNDDELIPFVMWTKDFPFEIRFLEYMPFGRNGWDQSNVFSYSEMLKQIKMTIPNFAPIEDEENDKNPTAKLWKVPGFKGRIGFITAMTDEFCGTCNRLRLTADGNVKACLFGENELSLRDVLRKKSNNKQEEIIQVISNSIKAKKERLGGYESAEAISKGTNRPMILIGG